MTGNSYCTTGKIHFEFVKTSIDKCCSVMTHTANLPSSNKNFILQTFRDLPMKCSSRGYFINFRNEVFCISLEWAGSPYIHKRKVKVEVMN